MSRRNAPPRTHKKKLSDLRTVVEPLEPRAMLAGLGQDSLSGLGSITAVLLPGVSSPPGIVLTGGSPTPGSTAGNGGSQSTGPVLLSGTGSGTGSSTSGSDSSAPNGPVLFSGTGSGTGSSTSGSSSSAPNGPVLFGGTGSGTGSTTSTTGGSRDPNSPVLLSQYTGGSNTGTQGSGTATGGTLSGSDLWLLYGAGLGAGSSSSGASGGSSSNPLTLLSQYQGGSSAGGQGNGTVGTLTNADLWRMYWSGAGAGSSSSGSDEGSLADDPINLAQYTGGSGVGGITPLVYNPQSDGPPVFHSGVFTGDHGSVQFVQTADQDGDLTQQPLSIGEPSQPVLIVSGAGPNSQVVFDGSDLPPYSGPGIQSVAPPRTLGEFLYDAFVADTVTVYGNTVHLAPNPRGYTVVGFFFANLVGVRGVSDAFSGHDAADAHEQSGAERAIDGVFGTIGLVCTALPLAKPAASVIGGPGAKAAGTAAGAGQIAGTGDDIARAGGTVAGQVDDAAGPMANSLADGSTPAAPNAFRGPAQRHWITKIDQGSVAKNLNTVIEPGVDVASDVAAINQGLAQRTGDRFFVNGRTYGVHDGTLYPISGLGLHQLDRGGFKALGVLMKFGDTPRAAEIMKHMGLSPEAIDAGRSAWKAAQS